MAKVDTPEQRANLLRNLAAIAENPRLAEESRNRAIDSLLPEDARHATGQTDAPAEVRDAAAIEAEHRALNAEAARLASSRKRDDEMEWRALLPSLREMRATLVESSLTDGGYTVPQRVSGSWVDKLRASSTFLRGSVQVVPFDSATFRLPQLKATNAPGVVAENTAIPKGDTDWAGLDFAAVKFGDIQEASNEILMDSALDLRRILADTMARNIASSVDSSAFNGNGTSNLKGLLATGNNAKTTLAGTAVKWDDIADAYAAIEATGGTPGVIWASPDMAKALRKEREGGATGAYLAGAVTQAPAGTAWGLPLLVSGNLPAKTVIVCDPSRVFFGLRANVVLKVSEDYGFDRDVIAFRATMRAAGVAVAEATSVQYISAT
ncbi:phage major capsid protein [Micromonospora chersina]|uniref:Phage major capsid protein, HK97 family n=1 Tax=Micromonospora chersina TaxID=47854 RepID=A0A1C6UT23_9ACTN|nr:phage major capsid protein [Micromonospora chersina]SCL57158.1 phage major capsid protein, HK97 family [Micromonospora chersina]